MIVKRNRSSSRVFNRRFYDCHSVLIPRILVKYQEYLTLSSESRGRVSGAQYSFSQKSEVQLELGSGMLVVVTARKLGELLNCDDAGWIGENPLRGDMVDESVI